ncbi:Inosine-5'-monophosphate dehydrogenase [uncultured archaeon]|nr:Inosine-5'-monophosphate dehydrogenase [uncultured archaeon]
MKLDVKIGECMTVGVLALPVSATVKQAAQLLKKSHVGSVIATEKGKAVGILTERDIVYAVVAEGKDAAKTPLKSVMSKPLKVIKASQSVEDAALALKENKVKRLPVVDQKGQLVGIVSEGDLIRVYPGMVDVMSESSELGPYDKEKHLYAGKCEQCGLYSEELRMQNGRLYCDECMEEEESA